MYKLTIFFFKQNFNQEGWQKFMGLAEKMPGLRRETVSEVDEFIFGATGHGIAKVHEFYFDSKKDLNTALNSKEGQIAGAWLHKFTQKRFSTFIAKYQEALPEEFLNQDEGESL